MQLFPVLSHSLPMAQHRIAIIVGSIREGSLNRKLAKAICRSVPDSLNCHLVEIADLDAAPASTEDVWLRLHLLSHRLVKPHGLNLDGIFGLLANVAWTSAGPCPGT